MQPKMQPKMPQPRSLTLTFCLPKLEDDPASNDRLLLPDDDGTTAPAVHMSIESARPVLVLADIWFTRPQRESSSSGEIVDWCLVMTIAFAGERHCCCCCCCCCWWCCWSARACWDFAR